ncbi:hypothetical protein HZC30_05390 [Candidatus Woesearchaeota archaeon]|nr:hypothetical protein [Candidatus Woesearchaeota archaeon]
MDKYDNRRELDSHCERWVKYELPKIGMMPEMPEWDNKGVGIYLFGLVDVNSHDLKQEGKRIGKGFPPPAGSFSLLDPKGPDDLAAKMALEYPLPEDNKVEEGSKGCRLVPLLR